MPVDPDRKGPSRADHLAQRVEGTLGLLEMVQDTETVREIKDLLAKGRMVEAALHQVDAVETVGVASRRHERVSAGVQRDHLGAVPGGVVGMPPVPAPAIEHEPTDEVVWAEWRREVQKGVFPLRMRGLEGGPSVGGVWALGSVIEEHAGNAIPHWVDGTTVRAVERSFDDLLLLEGTQVYAWEVGLSGCEVAVGDRAGPGAAGLDGEIMGSASGAGQPLQQAVLHAVLRLLPGRPCQRAQQSLPRGPPYRL